MANGYVTHLIDNTHALYSVFQYGALSEIKKMIYLLAAISEYGNEVHISGINGKSHGEIGVYPNHQGEVCYFNLFFKFQCAILIILISL